SVSDQRHHRDLLRLLRAGRKRQRRSCTGEKRDELAPPHCSPKAQEGHRSDSNMHRESPAMSALGQKQTYAVHKAMSALPPIATAKADIRKWSCPLYPQERTCALH